MDKEISAAASPESKITGSFWDAVIEELGLRTLRSLPVTWFGLFVRYRDIGEACLNGEFGKFVNPVKYAVSSALFFIAVEALIDPEAGAAESNRVVHALHEFIPIILVVILVVPIAFIEKFVMWKGKSNTFAVASLNFPLSKDASH